MTIARVDGALVGTDETTGVTIANNAANTLAETDVLGSDAAAGQMALYLKYTGTAAAGSIDVTLYYGRVTTQDYEDQAPVIASYVPISGTQKIFLGWFTVTRYMVGQVKNNAIGANITNVALLYELQKFS